jgi:hypothetical protein
MATRWRGCLVGRTWVSAQKGNNFWPDRWIVLKLLKGFPEASFIGVAMEWLLRDEDVWSGELEYRLKRAITFDPTVGSRSNFYRGFQRLFSLGQVWNRYSVTGTSCWPALSIGSQGHNFWSDRWIALKILQGFPEAVFIEGSDGMATRWRGCLVARIWVSAKKGHNFWSDCWMTLKFL